jgi:hypothetical protein
MNLRKPILSFGALILAAVGLPLVTAAPAQAACGGLLQPPCLNAYVDTTMGYPLAIDAQGNTKVRSGTFHFNVTAPTNQLLYQCRLAPIETEFVDCTDAVANNVNTTGSRSYTELPYADGYVMHVKAAKKVLLGQPSYGPEATFTFNVRPDLTYPETSFGGPLPSYWFMGYLLSLDLKSQPKATSYECTLDGQLHPCGPVKDTDGDLFNWFGVTPGDHLITARAIRVVNGIEVSDQTPAVLRINKPQSATKLTGLRFWKKEYVRGPMMGQYIYAERKGATITKGFQGLTRIALVLTKAPGFGSLKVFIDNRADDAGFKLVRRIDLSSDRTRYKQVVEIRKFPRPTNGIIKIVAANSRRVQIEGLGRSSL